MTREEIHTWLHEKLAEAERALRSRERMAVTWRTGDDESWAAAAKLHPSTAKARKLSKDDRIKLAEAQERIAVKLRREVEMFKAVIEALLTTNPTP